MHKSSLGLTIDHCASIVTDKADQISSHVRILLYYYIDTKRYHDDVERFFDRKFTKISRIFLRFYRMCKFKKKPVNSKKILFSYVNCL